MSVCILLMTFVVQLWGCSGLLHWLFVSLVFFWLEALISLSGDCPLQLFLLVPFPRSGSCASFYVAFLQLSFSELHFAQGKRPAKITSGGCSVFWVNGWAGKASWPGLCVFTQRNPGHSIPRTFWNFHARRFSVPKGWPLVVGLHQRSGTGPWVAPKSLGACPGSTSKIRIRFLATSKRPPI